MLPSPEEPSAGGRRREAGMGRSGMLRWEVVVCPQAAPRPGPPGSRGTRRGQSHCQEVRRDPLLLAPGAGGLDAPWLFMPTSHKPPAPHPQPPSPTTVPPPCSFLPRCHCSLSRGRMGTSGHTAPAASATPAASTTATPLLHPPLPPSTRQWSCLLVIFFFGGGVGGGWQEKC